MEPFPPPDSIGRDGLFLWIFSCLGAVALAQLAHVFVNVVG